MTAASAKSLFRATKTKTPADDRQDALLADLPVQRKPEDARRADDFYPTGQPEAIRGLFAKDGARIKALGSVWEPACGDGALCREIEAFGLTCWASDLVDRGWPGAIQCSYYDYKASPARVKITNPPYSEINARDGRGRWLRHALDMPGWDYMALLLSWEWPAAVQHGLGEMLDNNPFSYCYLMRWKLDFTGEGNPAQRNAWFVWDRAHQGPPEFRWMDRHNDWRQPEMPV